jgi:GT2 family glycosyltransferase
VPAVPDGPAAARFSVLLTADDWPDDTARMLRGLRAHAPAGTHIVVVANDPAPEQAARLVAGSEDLEPVAGSEPELLWTSARLGRAAALNVGLRRARGSVVILADTSVEITGDAFEPIATALDDVSLAVTGGFGLAVPDLRHAVLADGPNVDAIATGWLAFRREDYAALGPLDEKFAIDAYLDVWWSLVLRAGPESARAARRAVRLELPLVRHEPRGVAALPAAARERLAKRNSYRLLDRFRHRPDLLSSPRAGSEAR